MLGQLENSGLTLWISGLAARAPGLEREVYRNLEAGLAKVRKWAVSAPDVGPTSSLS